MLRALVASAGAGILYTHLGKVVDPLVPFGTGTVEAFRRLARLRDEGTILVTTTRRLLRYLTVRDHLRWRAEVVGDRTVITVDAVLDAVTGTRAPSPSDLEGMTFGVARGGPVDVRLADGQAVGCETVPAADGKTWVGIPWPPLRFPDLR